MQSAQGFDLAKRPGLSMDKLGVFLDDMRYQPNWRQRADLEADYYDGNQYDAATLAALQEKGLPPITVNLIKPTIDTVLGLETKTRSDWLVRPGGDRNDGDEMCEALTVKLKEAERMTQANRACADAYAGQIKAGLGWVEVGIESNPFEYPLRAEYVHRREIWWDWRARKPDLSDGRYLVRRKWYDADVAAAMLPQHKKLIYGLVGWTADWDEARYAADFYLQQDDKLPRDMGWAESEWLDGERNRVCLYEVWYRTWERGFVLRMPGGRVVEFDRKNPIHKLAVVSGRVQPEAATFPRMRLSWWLGPYRLSDQPSPYTHNHFPYVPFWGYREDRTGTPYGLIRSMVPMQDEVNARRSKMLWQLSATRVLADEDAVVNHRDAQQEVSRADAYIKLKADRKNANGFRIDEHQGLNAQQFEVYADSKQTLQDVAGVYNSMLGKKDSGADSGIAIASLVEQGQTTLAEINDNYRYARTMVGDMLLSLLIQQMARQVDIEVKVKGKSGRKARRVVLNERVRDPDAMGAAHLNNDVTRANVRCVLDAIPATATYRQQMVMQLTELTKALPEQLQVMMIDLIVGATDVPDKDEILSRIRMATGMSSPDDGDLTPEEKQAEMQRQKARQARAQLEQRAAMADIAKDEANARKDAAQAAQIAAETAAEVEEAQAKADEDRAHADMLRAQAEQTREQTAFDYGAEPEPLPALPDEPEPPFQNLNPATMAPGEHPAGPGLDPERLPPQPPPYEM